MWLSPASGSAYFIFTRDPSEEFLYSDLCIRASYEAVVIETSYFFSLQLYCGPSITISLPGSWDAYQDSTTADPVEASWA